MKFRLVFLQETEVAPIITPYWERAQFPHMLIPKIARLGIAGLSAKEYGSSVKCPDIQH